MNVCDLDGNPETWEPRCAAVASFLARYPDQAASLTRSGARAYVVQLMLAVPAAKTFPIDVLLVRVRRMAEISGIAPIEAGPA